MSFDNDYYLLSSATIASLLYNADKKTYIHLHIITVENFLYSTMKKLNSLKYKINKNVFLIKLYIFSYILKLLNIFNQ